MKKKYCVRLLLAGAAILFFMLHSAASAADKVVVVPLFSDSTTCTAPDEVLSGRHCWKDRDLGAQRVATSFDEWQAYGGLFQWGRPRDGHQHRNNMATLNSRSEYDDPETSLFVVSSVTYNYDWRYPQNDNLWQGLGGTNNPCPQGFRLPTATEWEDEMASWATQDRAGAFASLQLVAAGFRIAASGAMFNDGIYGYYWSSTIDGTLALRLRISETAASFEPHYRANAYSIRCLKD